MIRTTTRSKIAQRAAQALQTPTLRGLGVSFPSHGVSSEETIAALCQLFPDESPDFVTGIVHHSGVENRHLALPQEQLLALNGFTERNAAWQKACLEHGAAASRAALEQAGIAAAEVDAIIDVSCTGLAIPALNVDLAADLGLRPDALRIPITAAGCAGGALGLNLATQISAGGKTVLLVAMEMCTLTFVPGDRARANLVAGALFGDGAGAIVLGPKGSGPRIVGSASHLFPDSRHAMGFEVGSHGLRINLDRTLPVLLQKGLRPVVNQFLAQHGLTAADVGLHLVHTGGRRVLDVYEEIFQLAPGSLRASREALRRHGNTSSASVLTVLAEAQRLGLRPECGQHALMVAFGPGLSVEMLLMEWE
jgi:alkylresorcinol/alkylpyrone synthase